MRYRIIVHFDVEDDDTEMAEVELEAHLSDMINSTGSEAIKKFEILEVEELEIDEEEDDI